jgi:serine/threonine protein kinase
MDIKNKYAVLDILGSGKFGTVYLGIYKKNNEKVAIKMEDSRTPVKLLKHETSILKYLYEHGSRTTPAVFWYGIHLSNVCLVMTYYECSLYDYIKKQQTVSIEKINSIMSAAIGILESIHKLFVLHRDIKPQNFMIKAGELFLIDFGFATFYINQNGEHKDECSQKHIIGTPKYISPNIHMGSLPSRRDDLISLGYIYVYLYCRELPWDTIQTNEIDNKIYDELSIEHPKNIRRLELKSLDYISQICSKISQNISRYVNYCYGLKYKDTPNYNAIIETFA